MATGERQLIDILLTEQILLMADRLGSVVLSDERQLSGIRIQWRLSGDESKEWTVKTRPQAVFGAETYRMSGDSPIAASLRN